MLADTFLPFFRKNDMEERFGLQIAHRHTDLDFDEKMVHYGNSASPWRAMPGMPDPSPSAWAFFSSSNPVPIEYHYPGSVRKELNQRESSFMQDLAELQRSMGIDGLFAACDHPGLDFQGSCEVTQGRSNINLKPEDVSLCCNSFQSRRLMIIIVSG